VREADKAEGAREKLQGDATDIQADLDKLAAALPALSQALDDARAAWRSRCAALALAADTSTSTALALLEQRQALVGKLDAWNGLRQTRQDQASADLADESERVASLQARLAQVERRVADAVSAAGSQDEAALKTLLVRKQNQGPLLARAGSLFSAIT